MLFHSTCRLAPSRQFCGDAPFLPAAPYKARTREDDSASRWKSWRRLRPGLSFSTGAGCTPSSLPHWGRTPRGAVAFCFAWHSARGSAFGRDGRSCLAGSWHLCAPLAEGAAKPCRAPPEISRRWRSKALGSGQSCQRWLLHQPVIAPPPSGECPHAWQSQRCIKRRD